MSDEESKPVSRRECELKHQEVQDMKGWISKVDNRLWLLVVGLLLNLAGTVGVLIVALSRAAGKL